MIRLIAAGIGIIIAGLGFIYYMDAGAAVWVMKFLGWTALGICVWGCWMLVSESAPEPPLQPEDEAVRDEMMARIMWKGREPEKKAKNYSEWKQEQGPKG
jgi:hypothetical protein